MGCIAYRSGYKYQLVEDAIYQTTIYPFKEIITEYICLSMSGLLWVKEGYAFDGPSGPTVDRKTNMRGSLFHDAGYQLMREGYLDELIYRPQFDNLLHAIWIEDGMWSLVADVEVAAVKRFAAEAAMVGTDKPIQYAPKKC